MSNNKFEEDVRDVFHLIAYLRNSYEVETFVKGGGETEKLYFSIDSAAVMDLINDKMVELSNTVKRISKAPMDVVKAALAKMSDID